jgi:rhodanese-related sulfurtransferase
MVFTRLIRKIATGSSEPQISSIASKKPLESVGITSELDSVSVLHKGERVVIKREKYLDVTIPSLFNNTSRPCPPFCVQPMLAAPNVETIGELELLDYLQQTSTGSVLVVDSRLTNWVNKGTIPGSIHIPWTSLVRSEGATLKSTLDILTKQFSVRIVKGNNAGDVSEALADNRVTDVLDYSKAKTLVIFCNGTCCGQTSESIKALLDIGYPAEKIKYYRDGMQGWVTLGLTMAIDNVCDIVKPSCESLR